jgi:hypothetical protein
LENTTLSILEFLETQQDNFPEIKEFLTSLSLVPSSIFLPQSLSNISDKIAREPNYLYSLFSYLDIISVGSLSIYNDPNFITNKFVKLIVNNRTIYSSKDSLNSEEVSDFVFRDSSEATQFLDSNKHLIALYVYSLMQLVFYSE